ncbi:MAG: hypothetical protein AAGB34_00655 [Planctomycetota bacterium]
MQQFMGCSARTLRSGSVLLLAVLAGSTWATTPRVIYSNIASDPTSAIPGGGTWDNEFSFFTLNISTSGEYWLLNHQGVADDSEVLVVGTGTSGSVVLAEGIDGFDGRLVDGIDSSGRINNAGQWVVGADLDGDTSTDDVILGGNLSGVTTLYAQEGEAIDTGFGFGPGNTWDVLDSTAIDQSGRVYWVSDAVDGSSFSSSTNEIIVSSDFRVIAQKGVDVPGNQSTSPRAFDDFDLDDFHVSDDGSSWLVRGDIGTPTSDDDALFVNGNIVVRENFTLSQTGITGADGLAQVVDGLTGGIDQQFMAGNGDWYVFGQFADQATDWAIRNGELIASSGDEIFAGANEFWDAPGEGVQDFSLLVGNSLGDYILGGLTTSGETAIVLNSEEVVLRSGDAVDLDGDGTLDDVFIDSFEFQETRLGDNLVLYALVNFRDRLGFGLGSGFISVQIPAPGSAGLLLLSGLAVSRRRRQEH